MRGVRWLSLVAALAAGCSGESPSKPTPPGPTPVIQQIQPFASQVGGTVTITGSGFTSAANAIRIGSGYLHNQDSAAGTSIRFVLPEYLGVCPPGAQACIAMALVLTPGTYKVSVVNTAGTSNEVVLTVEK
jgi:hypothetical protein